MREITVQAGPQLITGIETSSRGPALGLCHGNSSSAELFRDLMETELGRRRRVIALNFPGHGSSGRAPTPELDYTIPAFADTLVSAIASLQLTSCVLAGHSLGGHVMSAAVERL